MKFDSKKILAEKGLKATRQRLSVLQVLDKFHKPLSANQILKKVSDSIDLVTIYRTLHTLRDNEIIFSETIDGEERYYQSKKQHHHIQCEKCNTVKCIPCNHSFVHVSGFKNIQHTMALTGVCAQCA